MRKPAAIAIFAASGIVLLQPASAQDPNGRPIALIPAMVPPAIAAFSPAPSHPVANVHAAVRKAVKSTYPSSHYQRGLYLKQRGDLDGALIEFLKSAQENPMNVNAFYEQAVIFRARGYTKLAQSALQQALAVKPDYREARMLLASVHMDDGQLSQAANELLKSLGINGLGGAPKPASGLVLEPKSSYGLMPPSLIQTPHGKLKLPAAAPPVVSSGTPLASVPLAKSKADPFAHKAATPVDEIGELLRGIPGFGGAKNDPEDYLANLPGLGGGSKVAADVSPAAPVPTTAIAPAAEKSAFDVNNDNVITPDMVAKQMAAAEEAAHPTRRRKKHRVAAWLDSYLDKPGGGLFGFGGPAAAPSEPAEADEPAAETQIASAEPSQNELNPIKLLERKRTRSSNEDSSKGAPAEAANSSTQEQAAPVPQPSPVDFLRRALSFLPLPIFHKDETAPGQAPAAPSPGKIQVAQFAPAPPVPPSVTAVALPTLARQSKRGRAQDAPLPASAGVASTVAVPAPRKLEHDGFMTALANLPKEIVRTVEQVFRPKPVDIPRIGAQPAPELSPAGRSRVAADASSVPVPSSAVAPPRGAYGGNLVEAQVAPPPPGAPMPVRPEAASRVANAPAPLPGAQTFDTPMVPAMPAPTAAAMPAGAAPSPYTPAPGVAQTPVAAPMGPTAGGTAVAMAVPMPTAPRVAPRAPNALPAPTPISASQNSRQMMSAPTPGAPMPGAASPGAAPAPMYSKPNEAAPPVVMPANANAAAPSAVPAPVRAATQAMPPALPMPPAEVANSATAKRLATQGFKFVAPSIASGKPLMLTAIKTAPKIAPLTAAQSGAPTPGAKLPLPDDEYAKRMKYLLEHGTSSLRPGEAFMFSEESGEGVLFMHGGTSVRRKLAQPRDHEEVARLRRPDILGEDGELRYNLSLLGKIIKPAKAAPPAATAAGAPNAARAQQGPAITKPATQSDDMFTWLKNVFKF